MKFLFRLYAILFAIIFVTLIYLYFSINKTIDELNKNLDTLFISQAKQFAGNLEKELHATVGDGVYEKLKNDQSLRARMEHYISALVTSSYKYIFVLYRDKEGAYRYLLDGSKEDKGEFDSKLSVDTNYWDKVYKTKREVVINQRELDSLWITFLNPVINSKNEVEGVIAIDFSMKLPYKISEAIEPLNRIFFYIFVSIGIMLLILLYQTALNIKSRRDSITDELTTAYNRNYLREMLHKIDIDLYQIMMIDIDHFKKVNDNYGHKAGDYVLSKVAQIIKSEIREDDIFIRFGGEEFLLFIKRKAGEDIALQIAQRLRVRILNEHFEFDEKNIKVTVSIGVACQPQHFKSINGAIQYADEMLYFAKKLGRNRVITKADRAENSVAEYKSINDVKDALENERVICFYQPIYDISDEKIVKYEALVRMIDSNGVVVPPIFFLDTLMYTNVYNELTKRVLSIVFAMIEKHKIQISINLNLSDIIDNEIYKIIREQLESNRTLASWLIVELLEYEYSAEQVELLNERLMQIKSYGTKIAVDDFGSGYSNFTIFKHLPVDIVKIDGSLIKDIDESETSLKIVKSILQLVNDLDIESVAEFVHSKEVYEMVKSLGVDAAQGYYLGKPQEKIG